MNKTGIEWADFTWNPLVGCKKGCSYCYAMDMNKRFKWIKHFNQPQFFRERLAEPHLRMRAATIFVGSMCDLFGDWVPAGYIDEVIWNCEKAKHHKFMFLTKNPARYFQFNFPKNCWLGATVTNHQDFFERDFVALQNRTFLSIEPLLGSFEHACDFQRYDLVIVGAMTGKKDLVIPKKEWIQSIQHHNLLYKENIKKYL